MFQGQFGDSSVLFLLVPGKLRLHLLTSVRAPPIDLSLLVLMSEQRTDPKDAPNVQVHIASPSGLHRLL